MAKRNTTRALYRNSVSYFGGIMVAATALLVVFALILEFSSAASSPYLGIVTYLVFPAFLSVGVIVFLYGMRRESLRRRREGVPEEPPYPHLDLNQPDQRRRFAYAIVGGSLGLILLGSVAYNAFIFTESVTFCGRICHVVMEPEYTAYLVSPHARVRCVDCHIGSGASWYVKSKLSGARQVVATIFDTYPRPIPIPITNLRPARATCEECHWPNKFFGAQLMQIPHFHYDESNTAEQISLLLKTGGGDPRLGRKAGIHWHMVIDNTVTYAATDAKQQHIPWVKVTHDDGSEEIFTAQDSSLSAEELAALPRHQEDCIACHNRPTHIYPAPGPGVDEALASRFMDASLPWIKKTAVDAIVRDYPDRVAAHSGLRSEITSFYTKGYPDLAKREAAAIEAAVNVAVELYDRSVFPAMNVSWTTYADNLGHRNWPGCFRCHDGRHVTDRGKVLTRECTACHTMPQRGPLAPLGTVMPASSQGWHPWTLAGKHATMLCNRCHSAGFRPPETCAACHQINPQAPMIDLGCDTCHLQEQEVKPVVDCTICHDDLTGLHTKGGHPDADCTDCHQPHTWKVTDRSLCETCHDDKKDHYPGDGPCTACHSFTS